MKTPIATHCNQCEFRTSHDTITRAHISMGAHELETSHSDQSVADPRYGWVRFHPLEDAGEGYGGAVN